MPPSPSLRISPARIENHKRGRSLEGGLLIREKDDDLALFDEMRNRERDNFLLHSTDDFDDSLSQKLRYFSDFKLGITVPARGESSDLLNVDGDKNDYDWLLTPPDTPLFPSLDDETPPINLSYRGRPRSQPISIARSTNTEKSSRASRSSASPHRLSPSPRSNNSTLKSRGRPVSASHCSSTPVLRPTTPSRSPSRSTTPTKPSTPAPRSSTPTPRRMSTGSSVSVVSSGRMGSSPVKASRGNSASPKLQAWPSNLPGFSTDAPPNLRTSLGDRPASYVRGSSPASRNGRGVSPASSNGRGLSPVSSNARRLSPVSTNSRGISPAPRNGRDSSCKRQSMSPTASRSASSSCSHDRDQFSSHSKGSVASSGDDDIDSLQSFSVSTSDRSAVRKVGAFPCSRPQSVSKKPSKILSSSAPKRSFDSALRQMDRRSPQNMFRPLLSSVPSTTFYSGKTSSSHRSAISRNSSSVTTSSNASSDQAATFPPDTEVSDHDQDHIATGWGKTPRPDVRDGVFVFDKVDEAIEDVKHDVPDNKLDITHGHFESDRIVVKPCESENWSGDLTSVSARVVNEVLESDCRDKITCSKCGRTFSVTDLLEEYNDTCPDCVRNVKCSPLSIHEGALVTQNSITHTEFKEIDESGSEKLLTEQQEIASVSETMLVHDGTNHGNGKSFLSESSLGKSIEEVEMHFEDQSVLCQPRDGLDQSTSDSGDQQAVHINAYSSLKVDVPQGVGISVLLKSSSSSKSPVVHGRTFTAINTPLDDLSYARDSMNSMRSSIGHGSASTSSSVDLSSSRQTDARVQRQLSCKKADQENSRHGTNIRPLSRGSSFSGTFNQAHHAIISDMSTSEENFEVSTGKMEFDILEENQIFRAAEENRKNAELDSFVREDILEEIKLGCDESCGVKDARALELMSHTSFGSIDTSVATLPDESNCIALDSAEESRNDTTTSVMEISTLNLEEDVRLSDGACGGNIVEDSSITTTGEVATETECTWSACSLNPNSIDDVPQEISVPTNSEDIPASVSEFRVTDIVQDILEESTVTVDGPGGHRLRSLTLEEATDTILFCSSIIQNLAYQAATLGLEKEHLQSLELSRPMVTLPRKYSPDRKDQRVRSGSKHTPKSNKARQRRVESANEKSALPETEPEVKTHGSVPHDSEAPHRTDSKKPLNLESKCNCTVM